MNMVKQHGHVRKQHQQRHQQQEQSQAARTTVTARQQQQQPPEATAIGSSSSNQQKQPGQQQTTDSSSNTSSSSSKQPPQASQGAAACRARGRCRHLHRATMAGKQTRGETEERYNKTGTNTTRRTRHKRKKRRHPSHGQPQHSGLISPTRMRIWVAPASLRRSRWGPWSRWSQWGRWSRWSRWGRWSRADEADGQADGPGRLQLHVSRHLNPFHLAYMHKKWCRKIDARQTKENPSAHPAPWLSKESLWWPNKRLFSNGSKDRSWHQRLRRMHSSPSAFEENEDDTCCSSTASFSEAWML